MDGKLDGLNTGWYENGQKKIEQTYMDGKLDGLNTIWYENGQKRLGLNNKDGKLDGLYTVWYENGQEQYKGTFTPFGETGIIGRWNEDGSVRTEPFDWEQIY